MDRRLGWAALTLYAALGGAAALCTLLFAGKAEATFPSGGSNGRIVYAAVGEGGTDIDIFTMNPDGSGKTNVTPASTTGDFQPAFSPDGKKIVYARSGTGILVMNADGSNPITVIAGNNVELPSFSPDGKRIAYTARGGGPGLSDVFLANADGS